MNGEIKRQSIERIIGEPGIVVIQEKKLPAIPVFIASFLIVLLFAIIFYVESIEDRMGRHEIEIRILQSEVKYFQNSLMLETENQGEIK
jgi:hypothetical protein